MLWLHHIITLVISTNHDKHTTQDKDKEKEKDKDKGKDKDKDNDKDKDILRAHSKSDPRDL